MNIWLRKYGDPILRKVCQPVEKIGGEEKDIFFHMKRILLEKNALGIAAPQIGIPRRMLIVRIDGYLLQLANPVILEKNGRDILTEGCLSIPEIFIKVPRVKKVKVMGIDEKGKKKMIEIEGILARAIQHEIDHLNGILIVDYATPNKKEKIKKRLDNLAEHTKMVLRVKSNRSSFI